MKTEETDEAFFRELMPKSKLDVPFPDFDDRLMLLVQKKELQKASISRDVKLSWIFFILGSVFGIIISVILPRLHLSEQGIPLEKFTVPFLIVFSYLLVTQLNSFLDFFKKHKNTNGTLA